jgi:hypothetical protein
MNYKEINIRRAAQEYKATHFVGGLFREAFNSSNSVLINQ